MSTNPQNNRDPIQDVLHFWSKFGDSSFNRWPSYHVDKLVIDTQTDTLTDTPYKQPWYMKAKTNLM